MYQQHQQQSQQQQQQQQQHQQMQQQQQHQNHQSLLGTVVGGQVGVGIGGVGIGGANNGSLAHTNGVGVVQAQYASNLSYPTYPNVKLKKLAFFDQMSELLKPSTLLSSNSQRLQEATYYFHLTTQQATDIASNR